MVSPHFSPGFYCGGGSGHVYCVALSRAPRRTVEYASGALSRAPSMWCLVKLLCFIWTIDVFTPEFFLLVARYDFGSVAGSRPHEASP